MRLLMYLAICLVLLGFGWQLTVMRGEISDAHDRIVELNCVHILYEDGSAVHPDAEIAHECLQQQLGWP